MMHVVVRSAVNMKQANRGKMSIQYVSLLKDAMSLCFIRIIVHRSSKHSITMLLSRSSHYALACLACKMFGAPTPQRAAPKEHSSPTLMRLSSPPASNSSAAVAGVGAQARRQSNSTASPQGNRAAVTLTAAQRSVIRAVQAGTSLFFTGPAGSGKSVLLRELIRRLPSATTAVTASTGIAACNIGGITLHSWAGLGKSGLDLPAVEVAATIKRRREVFGRWMNTRVLIVDEISMVDGDMLDQLNAVAKAVRSSSAPFGGLQLVLVGDFYQLPPVSSRGEKKPFAFQSKAWKACVQQSIQLTEVFRQADSTFVDLLNEARIGQVRPPPPSNTLL